MQITDQYFMMGYRRHVVSFEKDGESRLGSMDESTLSSGMQTSPKARFDSFFTGPPQFDNPGELCDCNDELD